MTIVLVDTSVWISHFREGNTRLEELLNERKVVCHPFVIGELACGNLKHREEILSLLKALPSAVLAQHDEVLYFIEEKRMMGKGLGYIDVHLLSSALLSGVSLWALDQTLQTAFDELS